MSPRNRILPTHKYTCTHTYTHTRTHIHSQIHLETCTLTKTLAHKLTYTQIVITDTGTCSEDSCKNKDTHICICGLFPSTGNNVYVLVQKQRKLIIANICICCQVMPWCANVPVFLDSPPPIHIDAHSRPQFSFCPFPLSRPCLCQNTKEILIFAFILTHITFIPGVCHKQKHYFQRQDKTIVSAIELSQVSYP